MPRRATQEKQKLSPLTVTLTNEDFRRPARPRLAVSELGEAEPVSAEDPEILKKLLPAVVAKKIAGMVPQGFELAEITFTGEVSGKPFGIGVSGQVSAVFRRTGL